MPSLLSSILWGAGARVASEGLEKRGGPSGYLITPKDGTIWDNTYGLGLGHVQYQGVNTTYNYGDITFVTTTSIDVYLSTEDESTTYYLARGIKPNPQTFMIDEYFAIPYPSGNWMVVINETQECQTPDLPPIIFQSAAPTVTIISNHTSSRRSLFTEIDVEDGGLGRRGPSGSLQTPVDGTIWDDTNHFGTGEVLYQGVDQEYTNGDITHVTTHTIDIWFETDDTSPPYFLARGIAPKNLTVDVNFQIPRRLNGSYYLVVNETQELQSPTLPPLTFRAAAPYISVIAAPTPAAASSPGPNIGAIVGGVVGGVVFLVLLGLLVFCMLRRRRRGKQEEIEREANRVNRPDIAVSPLDPSFVVTPFDLNAISSAPPEYTPTADPSPVSTPSKARFSSSTPSSPDPSRTSFGTFTTGGLTHSRTTSHARSTSGASSSTGYFEPSNQALSRNPSSVDATDGYSTLPPSIAFALQAQVPGFAQAAPPVRPWANPPRGRAAERLEPVEERPSETDSARHSMASTMRVDNPRYKALPSPPIEDNERGALQSQGPSQSRGPSQPRGPSQS